MEQNKKGILITSIVALAILIGTIVFFTNRYNAEQTRQESVIENQKVAFTQLVTSKDSLINETLATFNEIETELAALKTKENALIFVASDRELNVTQKQQILNDIAFVKASLNNNKIKITFLSAQLKKAGLEITSLNVKIAQLETTIKTQENTITDLSDTLVKKNLEITQLNTTVADQETDIKNKEGVITEKTNELNTVYLVMGNVKELQAKGVVTKEGGFIVNIDTGKPKGVFGVFHWLYFFILVPILGRLFNGDNSPYKYLPQSTKNFPNGDELVKLFKKTGLKNVKKFDFLFGAISQQIGMV